MNDLPKILVAEDDTALNGILQFTLQRAGFQVVSAKNGQEAAKAAKQTEFDVIISDQQMPRMTGIELLSFVRMQTENSAVPFVLLTAKAFEVDVDRLETEFGVAEVIKKPFSPTAVVKIVNSLLVTGISE
ncbi:MAG: response regulator [Planctomycetota bacterium]|nr:response regulator [Planctomycetota bacterium]